MTAILALLKGVSLRTWFVVGLIAALGLFAGWQWSMRQAAEVAKSQAETVAAKAKLDLEAFKGAYNTLAAVTAEQTRAVQAMREEGARRAQEGAQALAKARAATDAHRKAAERLRTDLAAPKPMTCEEAVVRAKDAL